MGEQAKDNLIEMYEFRIEALMRKVKELESIIESISS